MDTVTEGLLTRGRTSIGASSSTESAMDVVTSFATGATGGDVLDIKATTLVSATGSSDVDISGVSGTGSTINADVSSGGIMTAVGTNADTLNLLAEWIDAAEVVLTAKTGTIATGATSTKSIAFEFSGSTYVITGTTTDASDSETYATDSIIELDGLTSITGLSTTAAANVIDIM